MLFVVNIEGVLSDPLSTLPTAEPINEGKILYAALKGVGSIRFLSECEREEFVQHWLGVHGFRYDHLACFPGDQDLLEWKLSVYRRMWAWRTPPTFVVEANPTHAAAMLRHHIPTLVLAHPALTVPTWFQGSRPGTRLSWEDLVQQIEEQSLRAAGRNE